MIKITKKDHLKKVNCTIDGTPIIATVWISEKDTSTHYFLIQNKRAGVSPRNRHLWMKHGIYSWTVNMSSPSINNVKIISFVNTTHELW